MPPRLNLVEDLMALVEGLYEAPRPPARAPMRTTTGGPAGDRLDFEALARSIAARPSAPAIPSAGPGASMPVPTSPAGGFSPPAPRSLPLLTPPTRPPVGAAPGQTPDWLETVRRASVVPPPAAAQSQQAVIAHQRGPASTPPAPGVTGEQTRLPTPAQPRLPQPTSTSTQRQPITPSQAQAPQIQRVAPPATYTDPYTRPAVQRWLAQHLPGKEAQQFHQAYTSGFMPQPSVTVDRAGSLSVQGTLRAPNEMIGRGRDGREVRIPAGTFLGTMNRDIHPKTREAYNAYFALDPQYQGLGIAKTILRGQIDVYRRMGNIDTVKVSAGLDGGGHTWARFGFVPYESSWQSLQGRLRYRLLDNIRDIDPQVKADLLTLINHPDPLKIRQLANVPTWGRRLLAGTSWTGTLDLRNAETMRYFDAYTRPPAAQ
jgi:GNAT superfamily N-acetyltransferase